MWQIANIPINSKVVLAPMAGITSLSYREFLKPFGVGYSVTEMISDAGLVHHNKKTIEYLKTSSLDRPVAIQLFGSHLATTKKAIDIINNELKIKYDFLDINLGCPVNKVMKAGAGSSHLKDVEKLYKYISGIVKASPKPVTAKIRLGIDDGHINVYEVVNALIKAGVKAIGIHARTSKQLYSGKVRYELIRDIGHKVNVPIIISGDIFTLDDAIRAINITKASAVMVARGGVGNPYLITQIDQYFKKHIKLDNINILDNIKYCRALSLSLIQEKGEKVAISILRSIAPKFFKDFKRAKAVRSLISQTINTYEDLDNILKQIEKEVKEDGK